MLIKCLIEITESCKSAYDCLLDFLFLLLGLNQSSRVKAKHCTAQTCS